MFMSVDAGTYVKSLEKESKDVDEQVKALEKKEAYLESTLKNLTEALTEIIKRSEGAASK
jgi:chaperonin cofactor prefoldin